MHCLQCNRGSDSCTTAGRLSREKRCQCIGQFVGHQWLTFHAIVGEAFAELVDDDEKHRPGVLDRLHSQKNNIVCKHVQGQNSSRTVCDGITRDEWFVSLNRQFLNSR